MKNKIIEKLLKHQLKTHSKSNSGFTLTEVAIIAIIIGILSAIAAPSWEALITRQRIRAVNSQVFSVLKNTQELAKSRKESYVIEFRAEPPEYSIYQGSTPDDVTEANKTWQSLNVEGQVKANQIKLYVQANDGDQDFITFNHIGTVEQPEINEPSENTDGFSVTVSTPENKVIRCVRVVTLLGAMRTFEGKSDGKGCATDGS